MYSVYKAVMTVFNPSSRMDQFDHENDEIITMSSPSKLIEGGKARLARLASNHHVHISGRIICNPRARIIVRLWIRS